MQTRSNQIYSTEYSNKGWIQHDLVGGGGVLVPTAELCRSCVPPAPQLLYLNCIIVVHSSPIMLLLKLLYLILSFLLYHEK